MMIPLHIITMNNYTPKTLTGVIRFKHDSKIERNKMSPWRNMLYYLNIHYNRTPVLNRVEMLL